MFRPFLNSLMLGSLLFPFIAIAGSTAQGGGAIFMAKLWNRHVTSAPSHHP
ncbi:protein [Escherichia coli]|nr:protein [Escherichia coli]